MIELPSHGIEWFVDASGCTLLRLRDRRRLQSVFDAAVRELGLHPLGAPAWHRFPGTGGLTGFWMLKESHLSCHSFPEFGSVCFNLFCCRPRPAWPWRTRLVSILKARHVRLRSAVRRYGVRLSEETA